MRYIAVSALNGSPKGTPELLANITVGGQLAKGRIALELNATELAIELDLKTDEIDPSTLQIQPPSNCVDGASRER